MIFKKDCFSKILLRNINGLENEREKILKLESCLKN